ncbi:hypothetical protein AL035_01900 [Salipiger aestuarii]|nr:hypothetical protein AL035_01900 [Salipiger aestuarii]
MFHAREWRKATLGDDARPVFDGHDSAGVPRRAGPDRAEHFRIIPSGQGALPPPSAPRSLSGKMKGGVARRVGAGEVRGSLMER